MKMFKLSAKGEANCFKVHEAYFMKEPTKKEIENKMVEWWEVREMDEDEVDLWIDRVKLHHNGKCYYNYLNVWEVTEIDVIEN